MFSERPVWGRIANGQTIYSIISLIGAVCLLIKSMWLRKFLHYSNISTLLLVRIGEDMKIKLVCRKGQKWFSSKFLCVSFLGESLPGHELHFVKAFELILDIMIPILIYYVRKKSYWITTNAEVVRLIKRVTTRHEAFQRTYIFVFMIYILWMSRKWLCYFGVRMNQYSS